MSNVAHGSVPTDVLVVDDDEAIRDCVSEVLRDEGYEVATAENGEVALSFLMEGGRPKVVLLDLMMPVMSGWEVLVAIQENAALAAIPVIVVSAMGAPGACGFLQKPVDLTALLSVVGKFCC